jgi:hypothetical protein
MFRNQKDKIYLDFISQSIICDKLYNPVKGIKDVGHGFSPILLEERFITHCN